MSFAPNEFSHRNNFQVEEILSHEMKDYKQINVKYANTLYSRLANQYESGSLMNKLDATRDSWLKEVENR